MFVKVIKNTSYFKRFQVRFRRRREGKTDYYQRRRLVSQRKNKYNTPKWRFVVRKTNTKIVCQVVGATLKGDMVKSQASSTELKKYGLTAGLTNFAAAYCTGLLCSRRLLTSIDRDNKELEGWQSIAQRFNLVSEATGEHVDIKKMAEEKDIGRPFVCYLDLGLSRSTRGNKAFAAMKGAVDGGVHIPHKDKIFPKVKEVVKEKKDKKDKKGKNEPATAIPSSKKDTKKDAPQNPLRERIFGGHVTKYMDILKKDNDRYQRQFSKWDACLKASKTVKLEDLYKKIHAEIRKNPTAAAPKKKEQKKITRDKKDVSICVNGKHKYRRDVRLSNKQRKERVSKKIQNFINERKKAAAAAAKKK
jgi:large subunit ribosomal protein L5e